MKSSYLRRNPRAYLRSTKMRKFIIEMLYRAGSGHPGGSLSCVEILNHLYFEGGMNYGGNSHEWEKRDRFILSKGHAVPALYSVFTLLGWLKEEELWNLRKADMKSPKGESRYIQGHPSTKTKGIEVSTGSLGTGFSIAVGKADALKTKYGKKDRRKVVVLAGDGEHQAEDVWAAVRDAGNLKLNNLIVWVDYNGLQIDGSVEVVSSVSPLTDKYRANKWHVIGEEIPWEERGKYPLLNGHDFEWLKRANTEARKQDRPTVIIANTVKGFGVPFMENDPDWHGKAPGEEEYREAMKHLNELERECMKLLGMVF